jgi:hypothetical protein
VQGVNLIAGGLSYATSPSVYIGSTGSVEWTGSTEFYIGQLVHSGDNYYTVTTSGTSHASVAPSHTSGTAVNGTVTFQWVYVNDAEGSGATATSVVLDGAVVDISLTHRGYGYKGIPTVIITGAGGALAHAEAVVNIAPSGTQSLENAIFYVVTDEYNVYKCLDNNLNSPSVVKPTGTGVEPVVTADGYMWKFMFNVPIALRNKFLTDQYIPAVTALRNQFYSNGSIQTVRVSQAGSGYTSGSIVIQGDGYSTGEQLHMTNYVLASGGSGYDEPVSVIVDSPISGASQWQSESLVLVGQHIQAGDNIYTVAISGTTNTVAPVHRYGIVSNGTAALEYVGTIPQADVTVTDGVITDITFYGMISNIQMLGGGSGYTSAPTVNISGGGGTNAAGVAVINEQGAVIRVIVTDPGGGFTSAPAVTFGTVWEPSITLSIGQQIYYSNRLYTVVGAGTTDSDPDNFPVHSTGTQTNGTVSLEYVGVAATAQAFIKYGSGYDSYPVVNISGYGGTGTDANVYFTGEKTEATLIPIFENGALVGVQIDDEGVGYSNVNITVQGNGSGAEATVDLSPGDVNTLQANIELLTVDGRIMNIPMISNGYGYGSATVSIVGDGTGAEAVAVIESGRIVKINMTNYGSGYRWATVTIVGTGWGAQARAIIAPYGGHGKNALTNLFTRYLMFFSNMAQDKNQGFDVNNDYRQLGIIKRPRIYGSTADYTATAGSTCWVVSGVANTTLFPADALIYMVGSGARYRIVTNNGAALLLQSLDNSSPITGTTFVNDRGDLFTCSAVTAPTVDKYSGDMLFIDNRAAFTPTADQTITMRTVIKF